MIEQKGKKDIRYPSKIKGIDYLTSSLEYELRFIEMMRYRDRKRTDTFKELRRKKNDRREANRKDNGWQAS